MKMAHFGSHRASVAVFTAARSPVIFTLVREREREREGGGREREESAYFKQLTNQLRLISAERLPCNS